MISDQTEDQAFDAYRRGLYKESLPTLLRLAHKGDVHALMAVAWINEVGAAGNTDIEFGRLCYKQAADAGSMDALHRLGRLLKKSNDWDQAIATFKIGAQAGHLPSMCDLGIMLIDQAGNPSDAKDGIAWLKVAGDRGHLFAKRRLLKITISDSISIFRSIKLRLSFIPLTFRYLREYFSNPNSEKIN